MPLYSLWILETETPSGTDELYISSQPYRPDAGPYAGKPFLSLWEEKSAENWSTSTQGQASGQDGVVLPAGVSDRVPVPLVISNPRLSAETDDRVLDQWFQDGYAIKGKALHYLAEVGPFDPPPLWADFDLVFTGRITKPADPGDEVTVYVNSTGSATDTPLLTKSFTGGGTSLRFTSGLSSNPVVNMPSPPGICGGDWTIQMEASARSSLLGNNTSMVHIEDAGANILLRVYTNSVDYKLDIYHGTGTDTYDLNISQPPDPFFETDQIQICWNESTGILDVWRGQAKVLSTAILNPVSSNAESVASLFRADGASGVTHFAFIRMWSKILDRVDYADPDFGDPDLKVAYEFEDIDTAEVVMDSSTYALHIDLAPFTSRPDFQWQGAPNPLVGSSELNETLIPYAYGEVFHVPFQSLNTLYSDRTFGSVVSNIIAVYGNGAQHVFRLDTLYFVASIVNANTGTLNVDPDLYGGGVDVNRKYCPGQRVQINNGTFLGQKPTVVQIQPDPSHTIRPTGPDLQAYTLRLSGLSPDSGIFKESVSTTTPPEDEDFDYQSSYQAPNPYGGTGVTRVFRFSRPTNEPVTGNIQGDPTLLVTNPPAALYVSPSIVGNIISQMLIHNLGWTSAEYNTPEYSVLPQYAGFYARDKSVTVRNAVNAVLRPLGWLEEGVDGKHTLKAYQAPTGNPVFTFDQGEVVSVKKLDKFTLDGEEDVPTSLDVGFKRSYTTVDGGSLPDITRPATRDYLTREYRVRRVGTPTSGVSSPQFNTQLNEASQALAAGRKVLDLTRGKTIEITYRYDPVKMFTDFALGMEVEGNLSDFGYPQFGNQGGIIAGYIPIPYQGIIKLTVTIPEIS